jgi:hypothetical protein
VGIFLHGAIDRIWGSHPSVVRYLLLEKYPASAREEPFDSRRRGPPHVLAFNRATAARDGSSSNVDDDDDECDGTLLSSSDGSDSGNSDDKRDTITPSTWPNFSRSESRRTGTPYLDPHDDVHLRPFSSSGSL